MKRGGGVVASRRRASAAERAARAATPSRASPALPPASFEAPLHELGRDELSVFLYLALEPDDTARLVKELGLSQPGFRQGSLGPVQRCDLLADELRAAPEKTGARVMEALRGGLERPVLARSPLSPEAAQDLLDACDSDAALPLALWRVLCDPARAVREQATGALARIAEELFGPGGAEEARPEERGQDELEAARAKLERAERELAELRRKLAEGEARAESSRKKAEEAREKLQGWLKEARAREARATEEAARAKEAAEGAREESARLAQELSNPPRPRRRDRAPQAPGFAPRGGGEGDGAGLACRAGRRAPAGAGGRARARAQQRPPPGARPLPRV